MGCGNGSGEDETVSAFGTESAPTEQTTEKLTEATERKEDTTEETFDENVTTEAFTTAEMTTEEVTSEETTTEEPLLAMAMSYTRAGTPCATVLMGSMSEAVLEHKAFNDYAANNINHPNDFFMRVYAQTLFQTLIGYENIK